MRQIFNLFTPRCPLYPCMSEASCPSFGLRKLRCFLELCLFIAAYHHLGYPVSIIYGEFFFTPIDERHLDLASVVAVYRSYSVGKSYAVFDRKTASRPDLDFVSRRYFKEKTCWNESSLTRHYVH